MLNEKKIIEELKSGNQDSVGLLYEEYSKGVYTVILKIVHNRDVADDLVQATFVKLIKNIKLFDEYKGSFYSFICAIGKNTALDHLKKSKSKVNDKGEERAVDRETTLDDGLINLLEVKENVADTVEIDELMKDLKEAISELAESQQIAIRLCCERDFSYRAAARIMGISESSFKSILFRARKTLKDKIRDKYPDLFEEIHTRKYVARMIIMILIGVTALTGLVYAIYRICNEIWGKKTFTLNELRTEVSHDVSIISQDEALERVNFYLDVLGEEKATAEELKLIKDYQVHKVCWMVDRGYVLLKIDSENGELVQYGNYHDNDILNNISLEEIYKKLCLPEEYEICEENNTDGLKVILYAKKYGDIYNQYESVNFFANDRKIITIRVLKYPYNDREVLISEENAGEIAKENNIEIGTIELVIEKIGDWNDDAQGENFIKVINPKEWENVELFDNDIECRKVWKITGDKESVVIDANTGKITYKK